MHECLQRISKRTGFNLDVQEIDIERSNDQDLSSPAIWESITQQLKEGLVDVVLLSPPCNTFSRARFQWKRSPGPRPVRNASFPWGFPWLSNSNQTLVTLHNYFVKQCLLLSSLAASLNRYFIIEHPEDLGTVEGEQPASIWQLPEMRELQVQTGSTTWAIYQCEYGAGTPKPTRFISNIPHCKSFPFRTWPRFDTNGQYLGPLPFKCKHKWHVKKLIGKDKTGKWTTSPSAAYPPELCYHLASIMSTVLRRGAKHDEISVGSVGAENERLKPQPQHQSSGPQSSDENFGSVSNSVDVNLVDLTRDDDEQQKIHCTATFPKGQQTEPPLKGSSSWGPPLQVEWDGEEREIVDGFGLCSPNRWPPENRGFLLGESAKRLSSEMYVATKAWLEKQNLDWRRDAIRLVSGHIKSSPFPQESLKELRSAWAKLLPLPEAAVKRAEGQPFYLNLIAQALGVFEDPDWEILVSGQDNFTSGVPLGYFEPLPRTPEVFPPKVKSRKLDESEFQSMASNYKSAVESSDKLETKFREDEKKGMMFPTTLGALKRDFPETQVLVAALGAIEKPDGTVRPLHDGTHFVQVNNRIKFQDQLQYPGPHDTAGLLREAAETREACFVVSADISAAHRLVKIRRKDWPLVCCKADSNSQTIWVNKVGTFGVSSAAYWWTRLFAAVGRVVSRILGIQWILQLVFVDDLHLVAVGEKKFEVLWIALACYEALGTPFAYHKFAGGVRCEFVGYLLDYREVVIGITAKRGAWLVNFIRELAKNGWTISMRRFAEFLGRLGFVARVICWLKPQLSPLYAWSAELNPSTVATAPKLVRLVLEFIRQQLSDTDHLFSARRPLSSSGEAFRTDAKCACGKVVLGGVDSSSGHWFCLVVTPQMAPFLFKENGDSQWASASAELLATLAALHCFGYLDVSRDRKNLDLFVQGITDNRSNEDLMKKSATTKWPLMLVNMQLSEKLLKAGLKLKLRWVPRDENTLADELTNEIFTHVDLDKRMVVSWSDLDLSLLESLWDKKDEFIDRSSWKSVVDQTPLKRHEKSKW